MMVVLDRVCVCDVSVRSIVRALLEQQIKPVVDAMIATGRFHCDLHAGNVMVDDELANAWLIDFEGVLTEKDAEAGSPTRVAAADRAKLQVICKSQWEEVVARFAD